MIKLFKKLILRFRKVNVSELEKMIYIQKYLNKRKRNINDFNSYIRLEMCGKNGKNN